MKRLHTASGCWLLAVGLWLLAGCKNDLTDPPTRPSTGYIAVNTSNEVTKEVIQDADVFIDGVKKGFSGIAVKVDTGTHNVYAARAGFENSSTKTVYVSGNDTVNVNLTLLPLLGEVFIASEPQGAEIFLNDTKIDKKTPTTLNLPGTLEGLRYRISLMLDGYAKFDTTIVIKAGLRTEIRATLKKLVGSLSVNSIPIGASIYLNETNTEKATPFEFNDLAPGNYVITLKHPEKEIFVDTVEVRAFEKTSVEATLTRCRILLIGTHLHLIRGPSPTSTCDTKSKSIDNISPTGGFAPTGGIAVLGDTVLAYSSARDPLGPGFTISYDNMKTWEAIPNCPVMPGDQLGNEIPIQVVSRNPLSGYLGLGANFGMLYRFTQSGCESLFHLLDYKPGNGMNRGVIGVTSIYINPENKDEVWFAGEGAVWYTNDGARTISIKFRNLDIFLYDIIIDPFDQNTIYAAGYRQRSPENAVALVLKSTNRGNNWQVLTNGLTTPGALATIVADPVTRGHLYAGYEYNGVWESADGGSNWKQISPDNRAVRDLLIDYPFIMTANGKAKIGEHIWQPFNFQTSSGYFGLGYVIKLQK